jgi:hypothetical protein
VGQGEGGGVVPGQLLQVAGDATPQLEHAGRGEGGRQRGRQFVLPPRQRQQVDQEHLGI